MSFSEMTITLDDVPILVGILVMDHSVKLPQRITDARGMPVSSLGVSPQEVDDELAWFGVPQFDWNGSDPCSLMSWILYPADVFNVMFSNFYYRYLFSFVSGMKSMPRVQRSSSTASDLFFLVAV